jgi:hypothetical protein
LTNHDCFPFIKLRPNHFIAFFLLLLLFTSKFSFASDDSQPNVVTDSRAWLNLQLYGDTGFDKFKWYLEVQPRWRDNVSNIDQRLIRPALIYEISKDTSIWFGYVNVQGFNATSNLRENRLWQQFLTKFEPNENFSIKSQTRFEQRRFQGFSDVGYKIRHKFAIYMPFSKNSELSAMLYDEVHHNFNSTDYGASKGFEQNRFFIGLEWKPSKKFSVETGYLNQFFTNRKSLNQNNNIFSTTIYYNLD